MGLAVSCESREVFLVPLTVPIEGPGNDSGAPSKPGTGGQGAGGGPMMFPPTGGRTGQPPVDAAPQCEKSRHPEEPRPLGVYLMVDQSSVMKLKWDSVKSALTQFVRDTDTLRKVSVGLQYYTKVPNLLEMPPPSQEERQRRLCDWNEYVLPDVPIIPTADASRKIEDSLTRNGPNVIEAAAAVLIALGFPVTLVSESPIAPAIRGGVQGARDWVLANEREQRKAVVVLVTDRIALPAESPICMPTLEGAVAEAELGLLSPGPEIRTYVLAVGEPNSDLDQVAAAGGTGAAYRSDQGDLLPSLNLIRDTALPCDIETESGVDATSDLINVDVRYLGDETISFVRVNGAASCRSNDEWYSDVEDSGTAKVRLCPEACNHARSLAGAAIEVVYGCKSKRRID